MCIVILSECIAGFHLCDRHVERPDQGIRSPGTEVIGSCKPPHGCCELNSGPPEKAAVLSPADPHLQLLYRNSGTMRLMDFLVAENIMLLGRWFSLEKAGKLPESRLSITRHPLPYTVLPFSCSCVDPS